MGGAAHVLLHVAHARRRLDVQAAGIEHHALADESDQRQVGLIQVPADLDDPGRPLRRRRPSDRMDGRIVLFQQGVAGHHRDRGAVRLGDLAGDGLDLQGAHVLGRGVDHLAGQKAGRGDVAHRSDGLVLADHQPRATALGPGLVAVEQIGAQRPAGREQIEVQPLGRIGQFIVARRQARRQRPGAHRIGAGLAGPGQHAPDPSVRAGVDQDASGLALEVLTPPKFLQAVVGQGLEGGLRHQRQRDGGFGRGDQDVGHRGFLDRLTTP